MVSARMKILADAVAEIFRLTDIDDLARGIFVKVNAGSRRKAFQFLLTRHYLYSKTLGTFVFKEREFLINSSHASILFE